VTHMPIKSAHHVDVGSACVDIYTSVPEDEHTCLFFVKTGAFCGIFYQKCITFSLPSSHKLPACLCAR